MDIFIIEEIYPNASEIFSSVPRKLDVIKNDCIVVLDTNVLLIPYTTGKDSLSQIEEIYTKVAKQGRLIIPGQVAREFARNRANKIVSIYQTLKQKNDKDARLSMGSYPLLESLPEYQAAANLEKEINKQIQSYKEKVNRVLDDIKKWNWDDPVSVLYNRVFVGNSVYDPKFDRAKTELELDKRYAHKIPPGFKDAEKPDKGIGDFLIWKTILEVGKSRGKDVIFVSGDEKSDWRHKIGDQALYARHELVDEFRRYTGGFHFHIIQFSDLLRLYGASEKVVQEVLQRENLDSIFHISSNSLSAFMRKAESGFLVSQGSQANKNTSESMSPGWRALKEELINSGILIDKGDFYEFTQHTYFSSTSAAASIVLGRQASGPIEWLDEEGRRYKEHVELPIEESDN